MTDHSPAALPEVPLSAASGEIRDIYDAIAQALGVRLVNLVYRHLATVPGALEWAWGTVGPAFLDGRLAAESGALVRLVAEAGPPRGAVVLSAAGVRGGDADAVVATLEAYNRANPMNAISLQVVALALADGRPAARLPTTADGPPLPELLPIAPLDDLPGPTRALLETLARQATGGRSPVVPSLFRHLADWPDLLDALADWLRPVAGGGTIDALSGSIFDAAAAAARRVYAGLPPPAPGAGVPDAASRATLEETVRVFPPAICRMIVIGALLRSAIRR